MPTIKRDSQNKPWGEALRQGLVEALEAIGPAPDSTDWLEALESTVVDLQNQNDKLAAIPIA